jgi:hypothetical protein
MARMTLSLGIMVATGMERSFSTVELKIGAQTRADDPFLSAPMAAMKFLSEPSSPANRLYNLARRGDICIPVAKEEIEFSRGGLARPQLRVFLSSSPVGYFNPLTRLLAFVLYLFLSPPQQQRYRHLASMFLL